MLPLLDVFQFKKLCVIASGPFSFRWAGRQTNYKITCERIGNHTGIRVVEVETK